MNQRALNKKTIAILLILIGGTFSGIAGGAFFALTHDLPQIRSLETFRPLSVTRIHSADRVLLTELFVEKRDSVPLNVIPYYLKAALLATEDRNFYKHSGVDIKGILRAVIKDIRAGKFVEGASTITQQLAKTLFLTQRKTIVRKLKEALLAFQLERRYTKDEILGLYLNQVYYGSGAYGIQSAASIFFGKTVKDLTIAECALIAGMPKSPSRYSPRVNKKLAIKRRNIVLKQMRATEIISKDEFTEAMDEPLQLSDKEKNSVKAPYFIQYIKKKLEKEIGSSNLYKGGLEISTTLSYTLQEASEQAAQQGIADLETRMKRGGVKEIDPQCALISIDAISGGILAMVGGKDYLKSPYNRAVVAKRQPGSAFKPLVFAYAIERGFPQSMTILDAPVVFPGSKKGTHWQPENFSKKYKGEISLRKALSFSENIPAVRLIEKLGPSSVVQFAHTCGIDSYLYPYLSLALGTSEMTLLELTSTYSVFPNMGKHVKPFGVTEVKDYNGKIVFRAKPEIKIVMSRAGASVMTNMLEGVIRKGTGRKARVIGRPIAGKTGTTNDCKDALFIGFSPAIVTGVWVGQDNFYTLGHKETGARAALPIWIQYMKQALATRPYNYFDIPDDIVQIKIDSESGIPVSENNANGVIAYFKKGTEPSVD